MPFQLLYKLNGHFYSIQNMKNLVLVVILIFAAAFPVSAQEGNFYYENAIYNENIKTVLMYRDGFELSNPIIEMGEETPLLFKFDDLWS